MCGIAGIASVDPNPQYISAVKDMAIAIRHRGPDSSAVQDFGECSLANTKLAIVDLSERGRMLM
jgi:asparagine synthetase B (glutamine-hydrolysing)